MRTTKGFAVWDAGRWDDYITEEKVMTKDEPVTIIDTDSFTKLITQNERLKRKVKQLEAKRREVVAEYRD